MSLRLPLATLLCVASSSVMAQTSAAYPTRAARMIVPWTAGGTADLLARIAGQKFAESFGQQFVVDNRPGAGGVVAGEIDPFAPALGVSVTSLAETTMRPGGMGPSCCAR